MLRQRRGQPGMALPDRGEKAAEIAVRKIAAGQRRARRPGIAHAWEDPGQFGHRMLSQLAIGRDLAAEHRQERRATGAAIRIEDIVARDRGRVGGVVVIEGAYARLGVVDVGTPQFMRDIPIHGRQ